MSTFTIKQDDLLPAIEVALLDGNGAAVDLTGATQVRFLMRLPRGTQPKVAAATTVVTPAAGVVRYDWVTGNTDKAGTYRAEWEVTFPGSKPMTFPSDGYDTVSITADLD